MTRKRASLLDPIIGDEQKRFCDTDTLSSVETFQDLACTFETIPEKAAPENISSAAPTLNEQQIPRSVGTGLKTAEHGTDLQPML
jgi:hypothetical protein